MPEKEAPGPTFVVDEVDVGPVGRLAVQPPLLEHVQQGEVVALRDEEALPCRVRLLRPLLPSNSCAECLWLPVI